MADWQKGLAGRPPAISRPHELMDEKEQELELSDLYRANGKWSPDHKIAAATAYVLTGTSQAAARQLQKWGIEIADSTIRWWATQSSWWPELIKQVRKDKDEEIDALQTTIIHRSGEELLDRIEEGDEVVTKDGDVVRKKMTGRDLAMVHGTAWDKRSLKRGNPTSRVEKSDHDALIQLGEQMTKFAKQMEEAGHLAKPIEGEVLRNGKS